MNALTNPRAAQIAAELESDIGALVPALDDLVARVTGGDPTVAEFDRTSIRLTASLVFPDEVGHGEVGAHLHRYRDELRVDIGIVHDRMFARPDGTPSERPCYLNDFVASMTLLPGTAELPAEFIRHVVAGVAAARDGVRRHNRRNQAPWSEVQVTARVDG
jgi:hypothetical protein